mgnify:CR=1 FL=1
MQKSKLTILVRVLFGILIVTLAIYFVKTVIECISTYNDIATSFPWYTPILINSLIFVIPLLIEILVLGYFYIRLKKENNK